jgi:hypothetical protein
MASSELCIQDNQDGTFKSTLVMIDNAGNRSAPFIKLSTANQTNAVFNETFNGINIRVSATDTTTTTDFLVTMNNVVTSSMTTAITSSPCPT